MISVKKLLTKIIVELNSIDGSISDITTEIGTASMGTTATTIRGAIAELKNDITSLQTRASNLETRATNLETRATNVEKKSIKIVYYDLPTLSFSPTGAVERIQNVSASIPSGYSLIGVIPAHTGSYSTYFYSCSVYSSTQIYVQLMRAGDSLASVTPKVALICVRSL